MLEMENERNKGKKQSTESKKIKYISNHNTYEEILNT